MRRLALVLLLAFTGCVSPAEMQVRRQQFFATMPTCSGEAECRVKWEAAQIWVSQNIPMKIQTVTDVLIFTYGGAGTDATSAARVTKKPLGGGRYQIEIWVGCGNPFGCFPEPWGAANAFNAYVNTIGAKDFPPVIEPGCTAAKHTCKCFDLTTSDSCGCPGACAGHGGVE